MYTKIANGTTHTHT